MTEDIRRIKTKENIQNTFINIMAEQDLEKITVKAITSRARINKSTFIEITQINTIFFIVLLAIY